VIFPMIGEPVYLLWTANRVLIRLETDLRDEPWWMTDVRMGITGPGVVGALLEKGLDRAKIGVVGLESKGAGSRMESSRTRPGRMSGEASTPTLPTSRFRIWR